MTNNHNILDDHTYAAYLKDTPDAVIAHQVGIVSADMARKMIANSSNPALLEFHSLTALAYDSSLTF